MAEEWELRPRERELLTLLIAGAEREEVCARAGYGMATYKTYVTRPDDRRRAARFALVYRRPMEQVLRFIDDQRARFVEELATWVRELVRLKADRVELWETPGHPAVFAELMNAPGKPTLLVYGHHGVQPVDPLEEWVSPPLEPAVREGHDDQGKVAVKSFYDKVLDLENFHRGIKSAAHSYDELSRLEEQR